MTRGLEPPSRFIRLVEARDMLLADRAGAFDHLTARQAVIAAAAAVREALLAKEVRVFAWKDEQETVELDVSWLSGLVQPEDGTVFTLAYLRPGSTEARAFPPGTLGWLPKAELLFEELGFRRWLRKAPGKAVGRPRRVDAAELARTLVTEGRWKVTDAPGQLFQLLNERGRLAKPVGRETANRIARDLGYKPRPRSIPPDPISTDD